MKLHRYYLPLWNLINVLLFTAIIAHRSTAQEILGRYSRSYLVGIVLAGLLIGLVAAFSMYTAKHPEWLLALVSRISASEGKAIIWRTGWPVLPLERI